MLHVVVVGAGPAGLVAAEKLAINGVRVTLLERTPDRLRPCAGLLTHTTLAALDAPELLLSQRVDELSLFSPTARPAFISLSGQARFAGVIRRDLVTMLLYKRVEDAGVKLVVGTFRRFVHSEGDYPVVEYSRADGSRERLAADVVIGADGVASRVAHAIGLPLLELGVAYVERLSLPTNGLLGVQTKASTHMQIHLGRKISPDRYGWLMPQLDHLAVGVAMHTRFGKRVWDGLAELKKRLGDQLEGAKSLGRESFLFPLAPRPKWAHDRVLLVGDAAGIAPATTLDGLYYAATSGKVAAETIMACRHMPTPENLATFDARFLATHGPSVRGVRKLETLFFTNDKRREALVDLAWDRQIQRLAVEAFLDKKPLSAPLNTALKLRTRLATSLIKYALVSPKRPEGDTLLRGSQPKNYLDLALAPTNNGMATLPPLKDVLEQSLRQHQPENAKIQEEGEGPPPPTFTPAWFDRLGEKTPQDGSDTPSPR